MTIFFTLKPQENEGDRKQAPYKKVYIIINNKSNVKLYLSLFHRDCHRTITYIIKLC